MANGQWWLDDKDVAAGDKKTAMYYREIVV